MTQLLQKDWVQEDARKNIWNGSERPTMCIASMDIKTAVDAGPRHIANILGDQNVHLVDCGCLTPRDGWS